MCLKNKSKSVLWGALITPKAYLILSWCLWFIGEWQLIPVQFANYYLTLV